MFFFRGVLDQFMQSACFERHSESRVEGASEAVEMSRVFFSHASSEGLMKGLAGCVKMKSETQSDCVKSACDRVQAGENWSMKRSRCGWCVCVCVLTSYWSRNICSCCTEMRKSVSLNS